MDRRGVSEVSHQVAWPLGYLLMVTNIVTREALLPTPSLRQAFECRHQGSHLGPQAGLSVLPSVCCHQRGGDEAVAVPR